MRYILLFGFTFFFACKNKQTAPASTGADQQEAPLPEGFAEFYQRFHSDSVFQVEHIVFPLAGLPDQADSAMVAGGNFYWQAENWKMQKAIDFELSEYERQLLPLNKMLVEEHIVHKNGQFGMVRRFANMGNGWNLIYYAGMNRVAEQAN